MKRLLTLSSLLFAACGDNVEPAQRPDGAVITPTPDAAVTVDAEVPFVTPTPVTVAISAAGPDQIMSIAPGPNGTFYAAGFAAADSTAGTAKRLFVAKLTSAGALDTAFGTGGIYTLTATGFDFVGGTDEIDVVVQSTGKIVVAGTIAAVGNAADRDIGLFRLEANGALDTTFGTLGVSRINLSTGFNNGTTTVATDSQRGLGVGPGDKLFIHATARNAADAVSDDTDFTVARLDANGNLDVAYATAGRFFLELDETNKSAVVRSLHVLSDGSVIASGYARSADTINPADNMATPQPVLYRLDPDGDLVTTFADNGVFHQSVLTLQTEIYAFAVDGNNITTAGYGRDTGTVNVFTPMRFTLDTGVRSTTFGGATGGVPTIDPSGSLAGANNRYGFALPDGRTALIGSIGGTGTRDATVVILTASGQLDTDFGTGIQTYDLAGGEDQFWAGTVSGDKAMIGGWKGFASNAQTATDNDNSTVVIYDL